MRLLKGVIIFMVMALSMPAFGFVIIENLPILVFSSLLFASFQWARSNKLISECPGTRLCKARVKPRF